MKYQIIYTSWQGKWRWVIRLWEGKRYYEGTFPYSSYDAAERAAKRTGATKKEA